MNFLLLCTYYLQRGRERDRDGAHLILVMIYLSGETAFSDDIILYVLA